MVTDQSAYERKKELTYRLDFQVKHTHIPPTNKQTCAGVAELVDALDLGSSIERCEGSSPFTRTNFPSSIPHTPRYNLTYDQTYRALPRNI